MERKVEFKLRPWRITDLKSLVRHANNPKIASNLTNAFPHPYTEKDAESFIARNSSARPIEVMAIEIDGEACGAIGIHPQGDIFIRNAELGYWLTEKHWGKGIMSAVIPEMVEYGFKNFDVDRIFARPFGRNVASQKALEKAGFIFEAKLDQIVLKNGQIEDLFIYAVRRKKE